MGSPKSVMDPPLTEPENAYWDPVARDAQAIRDRGHRPSPINNYDRAARSLTRLCVAWS